mgnify:FL=1
MILEAYYWMNIHSSHKRVDYANRKKNLVAGAFYLSS